MSWPSLEARRLSAQEDIQVTADRWVAKQALGTLRGRDAAALRAWLVRPEHRAAFERAAAAYSQAASFAAEPEILQLRAAALTSQPSRSSRGLSRPLAAAAVLLVLVGVGAGASWWSTGAAPPTIADRGEAALPSTKRYETHVGERRDVRLDDGSIVSLNTGSAMEVAYNPDRRDVRLLRGQALFRVAHNRAWPFVVTAGDRQVTAVGTAFDVRLDGGRVKVVLVEGKVQVAPLRRSPLQRLIPSLATDDLTAGQQLVAAAGAARTEVAVADVQQATSWRQGQVTFRDDTLGSAVAELNRYSERRIEVADARLAALKVSGVFSTDRPDNFVLAVTQFFPVDAVPAGHGVTRLVWREGR